MKFDSSRGMRGRRANVWGDGGLFEQRLNSLQPQEKAEAPTSIIGGQFVKSDDLEGVSAATNGLRDRFATAEAKKLMREQMGSTTVTRGTPGGLEGNGPQALARQGQPGQPASMQTDAPIGDPSAIPNPAQTALGVYNNMTTIPGGGRGPLASAGNTAQPDFFAGGNASSYRKNLRSRNMYEGESDSGADGGFGGSFIGTGNGNGYQNPDRRGPGGLSRPAYSQENGFRNGGAVGTKQRSVKQPGYKSGGKVRMPSADEARAQMMQDPAFQAQMQEAAAAGYGEGPAAVDRMMWDRNAPQREAAEQELFQTRDVEFATGQPEPIPGYKWGSTPPNAPGAPSAPTPARDGYRWDDGQGMRGYKCGGKVKKGMAKGGQIGNEMEDDGKDTVDVRVREGEYLLNPPTVANGFGNGDYDAGVQNLNQIVKQSTGAEPGPTPVNEEGEAVRQGMRNGGKVKMGYNQGGFVDDMGNLVDPRQMNAQQRAYLNTQQGAAAMEGNTRGASYAVAQDQAARAHQQALRTGPPLPRGMQWERAGAEFGRQVKPAIQTAVRKTGNAVKGAAIPIVGGAVEAGRQLGDKQKNQYYNDPNVSWEEKALQTGSDIVDTGLRYGAGVFGGAAGAAAGLGTPGSIALGGAGAVGGYMLGDALWGGDNDALRAYRAANPQATQQEAEAAVTAAPGAYGRAFGEGDVALPQNGLRSAAEAVAPGGMNIVQETGRPGGEQIIREDINGVPTFTNIRQGGFRGDATTLQAEADARAAQDVGIRAQQAQVVDQMRRNAPIYTQEGVDQRRAEDLALQEASIDASGRGSRSKVVPLRTQLEDRFTKPTFDSDGNEKGQIPDIAKVDLMESVLSEMNPDIMAQYGVPFDQLPEYVQQEVYTTIEPYLGDTATAVKAQKNQGYPTSDTLRSGRNTLREIPNSDISFWGDAVFGDATLGEYGAGVWDGEGTVNDLMVGDPLSMDANGQYQTRIPMQRLLKANRNDEQEALRRYGYTDPNKAR